MRLSGRGTRSSDGSADAVAVVAELAAEGGRALTSVEPDASVVAVAAGIAGLASLVDSPADVHAALSQTFAGLRLRTAVAADALTAHLGALSGRGGAVVAVGTGAIALGTDLRTVWHRVDGWGHLLGDIGSGSWIGAAGLRSAAAAHDGRVDGSRALLDAAEELIGPVPTWPRQIYARPDRARVLASFTLAVVAAAHADDPVARSILEDAGRHLGESLAAAAVPGVQPIAAATGGVLGAGSILTDALRTRLAELRPDVTLVDADGDPLHGAEVLAFEILDGTAPSPTPPWLSTSSVGTPSGGTTAKEQVIGR